MLSIRDVYKKVFDGLYVSAQNYVLFPGFFQLTKVTAVLRLSIGKVKMRSSRKRKQLSLSTLCPVRRRGGWPSNSRQPLCR